MKYITIYFLLVISSYSQVEAFDFLDVQISIHNPSVETSFNKYFDESKALGFRLITPYYYGDLYLGIKKQSFNKTSLSTSNFDAMDYYIGWQLPLLKSKMYKWNIGFHFGSFEMDFESEKDSFYKKESEFISTLQTNFNYKISSKIKLYLGTEAQYLYSKKRIKIYSSHIGISYLIETPQWLKTFLR